MQEKHIEIQNNKTWYTWDKRAINVIYAHHSTKKPSVWEVSMTLWIKQTA